MKWFKVHLSPHFAGEENGIESVALAKVQKREGPDFRFGGLEVDNGRGNVVRFREKLD